MLKTVSIPYFHYNNNNNSGNSNKIISDCLSRAAELAVITGFSEAGRRRKNLILGEDEQLNYIAPFSYIIYAYPWRGMALLIKPFKSRVDLKLDVITDFHSFSNRLQWASGNRRRYTRFLADTEHLLQDTTKGEVVELGEFIPDGKATSLITSEAKPVMGFPFGGMLPYPLDSEEAKRHAARFDEIWCSIRLDMDNLSNVSSALKGQLTRQGDSVKVEMSIIEDKAKREADKVAHSIHRSLKKLERKHTSEARLMERGYQKDLNAFSQATRKLETELKQRRQQEIRFELEKKKREDRGDKFGKEFWTRELRACRRKITTIEKQLSQHGEKVNQLKSHLVKNLEDLKAGYAEKISFERQTINRIEKQRDQNVRALNEEILRLEKYTTKIIEEVNKQVDLKQQEIQRLGDFVIPWKIKGLIAISVPFYLVRYSSRVETRYNIIPPVKVETDPSMLSRAALRLVGLEGKMTAMIKPIDAALSDMIINDISTNLTADVLFTFKANEEAARLSLLSSTRFQQTLKKGLDEMVERKLLSQNEASRIEEQRIHWAA